MKTDLRFPKHFQTKGSLLWRIFDQHRNSKKDDVEKVKGTASEILGLYALMRHFFELRFQDKPDEIAEQRSSFDACCQVVEVILDIKSGKLDPRSQVTCDALEDAVFDHLLKTIRTYGTDHIRPKHHLNHALAKQYKRGFFDALLAERLHLRVKAIADFTKNVPKFALGVLD